MRLVDVDRQAGGNALIRHLELDEAPRREPAVLAPFAPGPHYASPDGWIRLSLSESRLGCSPLARQAVVDELDRIHRYPDPGARQLVGKLAELHEVTNDHVVIGNGADELLLLTAMALSTPDPGVVVSASTYAGHANAAAAARRPTTSVPLRAMRIDTARMIEQMRPGALVYICNPHNPSGNALSRSEIDALVIAATDRRSILVFDEAYIEYATANETVTAINHVRAGRPVVVLRTFSKIHGLAGLRCGYAVADPALCDELRRLKNVLVFNVNRLALAAAEAGLSHKGFCEGVRDQTRQELAHFQDWLAVKTWAAPGRSVTNFAFVKLPWPAARVADALARKRILVRDCSDLALPHHIRVSIGRSHEMEALKAALTSVADELVGDNSIDRDAPL